MLERFKALALFGVFALANCSASDFSGNTTRTAKDSGSGTGTGSPAPSGSDPTAVATQIPVGDQKPPGDYVPGFKVKSCKVSDPSIAACDPATGVIKGLKQGQTDVAIDTGGGPKIVHVTVTPPATIEVGQTEKPTKYLPGIKPTGCNVSDPTIASCDPVTGDIKGLKPGKTDVTVATGDGPKVIHLTVDPPGTGTGTASDPGSPEQPDIGSNDVSANVDTGCENPANVGLSDKDLPITPKESPKPSTVPSDCRAAIEFNNLIGAGFQLNANGSPSRALTLDVDIATYTAPDRMSIRAVLEDGTERLIFDTCRNRTWDKADPTKGQSRPPDITIRDYRPKLPKGTKSLKFDFSGALTPTYMMVRGLCDFNRAAQFYSGSPSPGFSVRPID